MYVFVSHCLSFWTGCLLIFYFLKWLLLIDFCIALSRRCHQFSFGWKKAAVLRARCFCLAFSISVTQWSELAFPCEFTTMQLQLLLFVLFLSLALERIQALKIHAKTARKQSWTAGVADCSFGNPLSVLVAVIPERSQSDIADTKDCQKIKAWRVFRRK